MGTIPPADLVDLIHEETRRILEANPAATSSEAFMQHTLEFSLLLHDKTVPRYFIRIGINYHGEKVQQIALDEEGELIGWNPDGNALGTGRSAKMRLSGYTIFDRDPDEPMMSDSKIGGGNIPAGRYVRVEFKVRGWLGKTKNLDGKQLEKDIDLLKNNNADLLVICLSEVAQKKWCGGGPTHHVQRRTGVARFCQILVDYDHLVGVGGAEERAVNFEGQVWRVRSELVTGAAGSTMPGATHVVTTVCRAT